MIYIGKVKILQISLRYQVTSLSKIHKNHLYLNLCVNQLLPPVLTVSKFIFLSRFIENSLFLNARVESYLYCDYRNCFGMININVKKTFLQIEYPGTPFIFWEDKFRSWICYMKFLRTKLSRRILFDSSANILSRKYLRKEYYSIKFENFIFSTRLDIPNDLLSKYLENF